MKIPTKKLSILLQEKLHSGDLLSVLNILIQSLPEENMYWTKANMLHFKHIQHDKDLRLGKNPDGNPSYNDILRCTIELISDISRDYPKEIELNKNPFSSVSKATTYRSPFPTILPSTINKPQKIVAIVTASSIPLILFLLFTKPEGTWAVLIKERESEEPITAIENKFPDKKIKSLVDPTSGDNFWGWIEQSKKDAINGVKECLAKGYEDASRREIKALDSVYGDEFYHMVPLDKYHD